MARKIAKARTRKTSEVPQHIPVPATAQVARPMSDDDRVRDFGISGLNRVGEYVHEEFLPELRGQSGMKLLREMRDNDATVGAMLFLLEQLIKQVDWDVKPFGGKEAEKQDEQQAQFFHEALFEDQCKTWPETLSEVCSQFWAGYAPLEVTWKRRLGPEPAPMKQTATPSGYPVPAYPQAPSKYKDGKWAWDKWAVRAQETVVRWQFDARNEWQALVQQAPPDYRIRVVPRGKLLLFRVKSDRDNPEGRSLLRNAVVSWLRKKKIEVYEGIGIERNLDGFPVLKVPEGTDLWNPNDNTGHAAAQLAAAKKLVRGIRLDEQMGAVLPFGWDLTLLSASGASRNAGAHQAIQRYEHRMAMTIAMDFLFLGSSQVGARSQTEADIDLFSTALDGILDGITATINRQAIPDLCKLNGWPLDRCPVLAHGDTKNPNLESLAAYITSLAQAGMELFPDKELEHSLRATGGLPEPVGGPMEKRIRKQKASFWRNRLRSTATHVEAPHSHEADEFIEAMRHLRTSISKALEKA